MSFSPASVASLTAANLALEQQIQERCTALKIADPRTTFYATVRSVFSMYDSGLDSINFSEFRNLSGHLGVYLTEQDAVEVLKELNCAENGTISFAVFYEWICSLEVLGKGRGNEGGLGKLQLMARAVGKTVEVYKTRLEEVVKKLGKSCGGNNAIVEVKVDGAGLKEEDVKTKIEVRLEHNPIVLAVDLPSNIEPNETFVFVDFDVADGADDEILGELYGTCETLLTPLLNALPFSLSLFVDLVEKSDNAPRRFRIGLSTKLNPIADIESACGVNLIDYMCKLHVLLKLPFCASDVLDSDFRVYYFLKAKLGVELDVDKALLDLIKNVFSTPPIVHGPIDLLGPVLEAIELLNNATINLKLQDPTPKFNEAGSLIGNPHLDVHIGAHGLFRLLRHCIDRLFEMEAIAPLVEAVLQSLNGIYGARLQVGKSALFLDTQGLDIFTLARRLRVEAPNLPSEWFSA